MIRPFLERVVWSPKHGGCLMVQRRYKPSARPARFLGTGWLDWRSMGESEYPKHDAAARRAVQRANVELAAPKGGNRNAR